MLASVGVLSAIVPSGSTLLRGINAAFKRLAGRRRTAILVTIGVVLLGRAALLPFTGIPRPAIADEFGYLLTADTFAHGRVTNPTHPLWTSFETFHAFHKPTYQSQYPIGYPVVLAAAQVALKNPWWGVFLTTGLMCGALTWMLQGWIPPYWALIGGLIAAVRVGWFSYWMDSFWGGSLAALGGCLVLGALPRLLPKLGRHDATRARQQTAYSTVLAIGIAILANTRPFEGAILCLPVALFLVEGQMSRAGLKWRTALKQIALPCILVLGITGAGMLYYQYRVTGNPLKSPYSVAFEQYHVVRPFLFQAPGPLHQYNHVEFRWIYGHFEPGTLNELQQSRWGYFELLGERFKLYWQFYIGPLLTLPLIAGFFRLRDSRYRFLWLTAAFVGCGVLVESFVQAHYIAPVYCLVMLFVIQGIRQLRALRIRNYRAGVRVMRALIVVFLLSATVRVASGTMLNSVSWPPSWGYSTFRLPLREALEDKLKSSPGNHLVIVHYVPAFHNIHNDIVYNGADLENAKILWARSMDVAHNCALAQHYAKRHIWIVNDWGSVKQQYEATPKQVCDPSNAIYESSKPIDWYTKLAPDSLLSRLQHKTLSQPRRSSQESEAKL